MSAIRVLIVDDHPVVRAGLTGILASAENLTVVGEAADGAEAIQLVPRLKPDVVLMDLRMPQVDGVTAIRSIRETADAPSVLVLTTHDTDAQILAAVEAGASGYLLKDCTRDELLNAIRSTAAGGVPLSPAVAARLVDRVQSRSDRLSARETDVLSLVARGSTNNEIARDLQISEATVKSHLLNIFSKLSVGDRTSAVMAAIERGLIEIPRR